MRRLALVLGLAPALAFAEGRATYGGEVKAALPSAAVAIDPLSPAAADAEIAALVFDTPFRLDASGQPRAHLALALDPPPPGTGLSPAHARLKLRGDVKWHDNRPLKAADVAASLARGLRDPRGWMLGPIRSARALSDDVVEIELSRAAPDLALLLATPAAMVTPGGAPPEPRPMGTGPFAVESVAQGVVRLVSFPACFAGRPYLDALALRAFAGRFEEIQTFEVGQIAAGRQATPRRSTQAVEGPPISTGWLAVGARVTEPSASALREALATGVDRERLRKLARGAARPAVPAADPVKARAQLEKRWPGERRVVLVYDRSQPDDKAVADRLVVELGRIGVDLTIEDLDPAAYHKRVLAQDYALALGVTAAPAPGLGDLALLAVVDPQGARDRLARGPASPVDLSQTRLVPLYQRATRMVLSPELRGVQLDAAGRPTWAEAWLRKRP